MFFSAGNETTDRQNKSARNCSCWWLTQPEPVSYMNSLLFNFTYVRKHSIASIDCTEHGRSFCDITHRFVMGCYETWSSGLLPAALLEHENVNLVKWVELSLNQLVVTSMAACDQLRYLSIMQIYPKTCKFQT